VIKFNIKVQPRFVKALKPRIREAVEAAGTYAVTQLYQQIMKRWADGLDAENKPLAPYSKQYLDYRLKNGRSKKPNMIFTGSLHQSVVVEHVNGHLTWRILAQGFDSNGVSNSAKLHWLATAKKKRETVTLSKVRLAYLVRKYNNRMNQALRDAGL